MPRSNATQGFRLVVSISLGLLSLVCFAPTAHAQPTGNEMCGDGTTFTVHLPGTSLGIDNSDGFFRNVIVPNPGPDDSITLPNGCSLYVLLVSGYRQNVLFDKIIFFQVAEFAAKNNGYVHVAWWNNLSKEYMGGPLHPANVTIERFLFPDVVIPPNPGGYDFIRGNVGLFLPDNLQDFPKANPGSDEQFQNDAAIMIREIKARNPNALIVVAGHSMGGDSVARLGRTLSVDDKAGPAVPIDLLAVIDPANNQDLPRGLIGQRNFNWTRWRAAHDFLGFRQWDCVRNNLGLCRDFDPRIFHFQANCIVSPTLHIKPPLPSLAPVHCPALLPIADPGTRRGFGASIRHLYHRWQTESLPPSDFLQAERFNFPAPLSTSILGPNYQEPFLENFLLEGDPNKTCANELSPDPRRNDIFKTCVRWDGHGEIVGYRGFGPFPLPFVVNLHYPGLGMLNWPLSTDAAFRRDRMIELPTADATWPYRPEDPDTCMVCDDIISIIVHLLAQQTPPPPADVTAPFTVATPTPGPNANGWNNEDVVVTLDATDNTGGAGVKEIEHLISGASPAGTVVTPGSSAQETVTAEGATTLAFFARDNASPANVEATKTLDVKIDKTPPHIATVTDVQRNASGWMRTDVLVSFPASDALSGLASSSPNVLVSTEGAARDITGTAEDNAGNQATAIVTLNIDKTAPGINLASRTPAANPAGWNNTDVNFTWDCTDALSGAASPSVTQSIGGEGAAQMVIGTCTDLAANTASDTQAGINIDKTSPTTAGTPSRGPDQSGWYNHSLSVAWTGADLLSGIASCSPDSPYNGPDSASTSVSGACSDKAGNASAAATVSFQFDDTNPAVSITTPPSGAAYLLNAAVNSDYVCTDGLSGVQSCSGPVASGAAVNTASVGAKQFTVNSSDVAGNSASATHNYAVHYAFSGFAYPIGPLPLANVVNAGRTVPVKYYLQNANGAFISDLASFVSLLSAPVACDAGAPGVLAEETDAAGSTSIRYDATSNQFIYNWKTDASWAGSCRALQLTLADGTQHLALFQFK